MSEGSDPTAIGRWLRRGGENLARLLDEVLWQAVQARWAAVGVPTVRTLVFDSTVVLRYGRKPELPIGQGSRAVDGVGQFVWRAPLERAPSA